MNLVILGKPRVLLNGELNRTIEVHSVLGKIDVFILFHLFIMGKEGSI